MIIELIPFIILWLFLGFSGACFIWKASKADLTVKWILRIGLSTFGGLITLAYYFVAKDDIVIKEKK